MHGKFNRFPFSLNAVLCTTQELHTQHYVGIDILPCDSSQQILITHTRVIQMLSTMYALMCYMTTLLTKCFITDITAIQALTSMHDVCYHVDL